ncbi:cell adhesion molecule 2 [Willisornis vidua]|uniref:Cell adhesion molecule 2 n=1 Tax=Willisornis vidua TaxID=1566151 RepID=A0ABQ9D2B3_9PASS|nr:cell adhesion molecule 2 [Willisornis vidua]
MDPLLKLYESENHRIAVIGRDLWTTCGPTVLLKLDQAAQVALDHAQSDFDFMQTKLFRMDFMVGDHGFSHNQKALRDNRIELVRASWHELSISVSDVSLSDEGQYTCSLFTMPVKTSKAFLTVLGVPEKPQITGFTSPVMEGERMQLTCKTSGSKPAADIRWFKNDKEVKDVKYIKEEDANRKTFTVSSTLDFLADRNDDGAVISCRVDHESLNSTPQIAMQVLEIHLIVVKETGMTGRLFPNVVGVCWRSGDAPVVMINTYTPLVKIISSNSWPEEGQTIILTCESKGKPVILTELLGEHNLKPNEGDKISGVVVQTDMTGNRPEPVLWTKDGGELPDPERMVVNGRVLSISFLNKTDNGTYRCEAKNPIGRNSTEYVLIVHGVKSDY